MKIKDPGEGGITWRHGRRRRMSHGNRRLLQPAIPRNRADESARSVASLFLVVYRLPSLSLSLSLPLKAYNWICEHLRWYILSDLLLLWCWFNVSLTPRQNLLPIPRPPAFISFYSSFLFRSRVNCSRYTSALQELSQYPKIWFCQNFYQYSLKIGKKLLNYLYFKIF